MQVLEHRHAVIVLVHLGIRSSAAALIRPSFEALFRGVWALKAASEDQIQNIFKTDHPSVPPIKKVIEQLRKNKEARYLADLDFWQAGGDYVHSGPLQMNRWLSRDGIEPLHTDRDAIVMLEISDLCALLAIIEMCKSCSQSTTELEEKLSEHTLRRISQKAARVYFGTDDQ
jgi:hypothetical protein